MSEKFPRELWDDPAFHKGREWGRSENKEQNLYTLKIMRESLLDAAQAYNQMGDEREMFATTLAAKYMLEAILKIQGKNDE